MFKRYVLLDLIRNPRRTLSTLTGVMLGVGLLCGVLFFVDGLSTSMTQRSVAPLAIDMQRIISKHIGSFVSLTQTIAYVDSVNTPDIVEITLKLKNEGNFIANDVTVRSRLKKELIFIKGSAEIDGKPLDKFEDNPFAHGLGRTGYNLGSVKPGEAHFLSYRAKAENNAEIEKNLITTFSTRESLMPVKANKPQQVPLSELSDIISKIEGVKLAEQLSYADLGYDKITFKNNSSPGMTRIFGLNNSYAKHDETISITSGELIDNGAVLSIEASRIIKASIGDSIIISLPDSSFHKIMVTGIADLSRSRALFNSRRGADLEEFLYIPSSLIITSKYFEEIVFPAYQSAASENEDRLKNPPVREIDIWLDHALLNGSPEIALTETKQINSRIKEVAAHQDYVLDNISNTLEVAVADAHTAKKLFFFLGIPGGFLAAMLAAYAANVLASAQRREQATLRVRGASGSYLFKMLALRTFLITTIGTIFGLLLGFVISSAILGYDSMLNAGFLRLSISGLLGTMGGFLATGISLYLTGHVSIVRQINEERARLSERTPYWRRLNLDIFSFAILVIGTAIALLTNSFEGSSGSVYFGKGVDLNLIMLVFPVMLWFSGSYLFARFLVIFLSNLRRKQRIGILKPWPGVFWLSINRRPWPIAYGSIIISLIVALSVSLSGFTASYNRAKKNDALYAAGSDIRIIPDPTSMNKMQISDTHKLKVDGIKEVTPVYYSVQNVIIRSNRTSDPANMLAVDPDSFGKVAPLYDLDFNDITAEQSLNILKNEQESVFLSDDMADFLQAEVGDTLHVLLERGSNKQTEIMQIIKGTFKRLPGCPDGAHAFMSIHVYSEKIPEKAPDFFLASVQNDQVENFASIEKDLENSVGKFFEYRLESKYTVLSKDQSSLAALNIAGLVKLDSIFAFVMAIVTIGIFVFGLLFQRRREYITLKAQGLKPNIIRSLIAAEASSVALGGSISGILVGITMGFYFVKVLQPLFVHVPVYVISIQSIFLPISLVFIGTVISSYTGSRQINSLNPMELLRDE